MDLTGAQSSMFYAKLKFSYKLNLNVIEQNNFLYKVQLTQSISDVQYLYASPNHIMNYFGFYINTSGTTYPDKRGNVEKTGNETLCNAFEGDYVVTHPLVQSAREYRFYGARPSINITKVESKHFNSPISPDDVLIYNEPPTQSSASSFITEGSLSLKEITDNIFYIIRDDI